jgi:hypothetical protein
MSLCPRAAELTAEASRGSQRFNDAMLRAAVAEANAYATAAAAAAASSSSAAASEDASERAFATAMHAASLRSKRCALGYVRSRFDASVRRRRWDSGAALSRDDADSMHAAERDAFTRYGELLARYSAAAGVDVLSVSRDPLSLCLSLCLCMCVHLVCEGHAPATRRVC